MMKKTIGMDKNTGKAITGLEHLKQSISDILTTRKGTRVKRREYGSNILNLIDAPINKSTLLNIYTEAALSLAEYEPRIKVKNINTTTAQQGKLEFNILATLLFNGQDIKIDGVQVAKNGVISE